MANNNNNSLQTLVVKGQITATSNKISEEFKQQKPTKTIYFNAASVEDENKLIEFGLQAYTSKDDNETFFIAKAPAKGIQVWCQGKQLEPLNVEIESPNFKSADGVEIGLAITKGQKMNRDFYRVSAVDVVLESDIEPVEMTNPFE